MFKNCANESWATFENQDYMDFQKDIQADTSGFHYTTTLTIVFAKV